MTEIYRGLHVTWMINLWDFEYVQLAKAKFSSNNKLATNVKSKST